MAYNYKKRKKPLNINPERRIERTCLKCDGKFIADGRFERICPNCTPGNRHISETHTEEALLWGGDELLNLERYLLRAGKIK